ncbi:MAG: insecticidal toxin complex protein [Lewinellaceae bacterium]|nr:insecticidal toxin complex protein [Lewinellaceae bacterium]
MDTQNRNSPDSKRNFSGQPDLSALAKEHPTQSAAIQVPEISLPKGGGALRGIDEKFEVNAANGTAAFSIPMPVTPGRNRFSPTLSLSYNSGGGNSPFGLGWSLDLPVIQRKTDKKLPRYLGGGKEDTFVFSGVEDLVPKATSEVAAQDDNVFTVQRYLPRIEGSFARIEKIIHPNPDTGIYWKVTTRENIATLFGRTTTARIADPGDPARIFQWLPEFTYDDKGNWIKYSYKVENLENVPDNPFEKNRINGLAPFANTYLKSVRYGNLKPYYPEANPVGAYDPPMPDEQEEFFFELIFDYGEHDLDNPKPDDNGLWNYREDAFSSYRAGFEIRANRLCNRILMFHHFPEEKQFVGTPKEEPFGKNYLVRSLNLDYQPSSINDSNQSETTYLTSITQFGYIRKPDGSYSPRSLPPMEFTYQALHWNDQIKAVSEENIVNAPVGLTNNYQWVDLYNEGISGILTEQGTGWFYKSNLGDVDGNGEVCFAPAREVIPRPSFSGLSNGVLSIQDLAANGEKQVVVNSLGLNGYFQLTHDNGWEAFQEFAQVANIGRQDPNTRLIDLNGDGQPELVVTEEKVFVWYAADGKRGHLPAEYAAKTLDEEAGPAIVFADQEQSIFLADMSGDGMTDIVRIRNGEVCYWANMGYGRFSAKITMDGAPIFDHPDLFNPQYLHLADVSGTGATDIVYLGTNTFRAYLNLSGNAWSPAHEIDPFFPIDGNSKLSVVDLLGTGTSCIVWSSDLPAYADAPMRYIDLMNSRKPHVLIHYKNNFGKETTIEYKSSTHFYLKDKLAGRPWITKLPFPVQVASKMIVEEKITGARFTSQYRYHHGYYDHIEREFRGFGMVEQIDTEHYDIYKEHTNSRNQTTDLTLYQAPVLTKTWYHTGAFLDRDSILSHFKEEYWQKEFLKKFPSENLFANEPELPDAHLSDEVRALSGDEFREALRACKGMVLRQEIFSLDAPGGATEEALKLQRKPYSVATHNCHIQLLQPRGENRHGVFLVTESEALTLHYERDESDPRIAHTLNVKIDNIGNILETASVVYPRKQEDAGLPDEAKKEQKKTLITFSANRFAVYQHDENTSQDADLPHAYRLRRPSETKTYELNDLPRNNGLYQLADFKAVLDDDKVKPIAYQVDLDTETDPFPGKPKKRLIEHVRSLYYKDGLSAALPFGQFEPKAIPYESYQLAYTPELLTDIFGQKISGQNGDMTSGKFMNWDGNWWVRSGVIEYDATFFQPVAYTDPYGSRTEVRYYKDYFLLIAETKDAHDNRAKAISFNFRALAPRQLRDANYNLAEVRTDELGLVKAVAVLGKDLDDDGIPERQLADNLDGIEEWTDDEQGLILDFLQEENSNELNQKGRVLLKNATSRFVYGFGCYRASSKQGGPPAPVVVGAINREQHHSQNPDSPIQLQFEYSDGLGKVAMAKVQAEPGMAKSFSIDPGGNIIFDEVNTDKDYPDSPRLRWVGAGRTVLNNKGNPVKQYEPYFSVTPRFDRAEFLAEVGVTPILYYDAPGRLIKTEMPDKTFAKVEFNAWVQVNYDQNDTLRLTGMDGTVVENPWYTDRIHRQIDDELTAAGKGPVKEQQAARKAVVHANTPSVVHLDTLGRPILSIAHNKKTVQRDATGNPADYEDEFHATYIQLDIEGNARSITDARGNVVMRYRYDMLGHRVYQNSMDSGERWMFNNVMGNPVRRWDSRDHLFSFEYDALQRPVRMRVADENGAAPLEKVYETIEYGDEAGMTFSSRLAAAMANRIGQVNIHSDSSGRVEFIAYDIKGNLLRSQKRHLQGYKELPDWNDAENSQLEEEIFQLETEFDALDRPVKETVKHWGKTPDEPEDLARPNSSSYTYNEAGLLEKVKAVVNGKPEKEFVKNINYDEKGQRTEIQYGNGVTTTYTYDKETFRLINLRTVQADDNGKVFQDLKYTYDPVGNITAIRNDANDVIFFNNQRVEPDNDYEYDPLYRLIMATGRDHAGQIANGKPAFYHRPDGQLDSARTQLPHPGDGSKMQRYRQYYEYDEAGNMARQVHRSGLPGHEFRWTKAFGYKDTNNQLKKLTLGEGAAGENDYTFDAHGNMQALQPNAANGVFALSWNPFDQLENINLPNDGQAYYTYNAAGQRTRKVIDDGNGILKERIYFGHFEVFRQRDGLERETWHIQDDTQRIALVETKTKDVPGDDSPDELIRYQFSNHLGTACLELDDSATVISYEEYYPYGSTSYQAVNADIKAAAKRYRYTGKERDEESGLYYYGARYYASWLCRWCSADPAGLVDGGNLYWYVASNPVRYIDEKGKRKKDRTIRTLEDFEAFLSRTGKIHPIFKHLSFKGSSDNQPRREHLKLYFDSTPPRPDLGGRTSRPRFRMTGSEEIRKGGKDALMILDHHMNLQLIFQWRH